MAQGTTSRGDGGSAPDARAPAPVRLAARHEVPEHLRFNKFILHGYRSPQLTPMECLKSSAYLHNETVNVLTHLAPLVVTVVLLCGTDYAGRGVHYETARMVTSAGALSMFASVMYHLLMPATASEEQYRRLLMFDVVGVWAVFSAGTVAVISLGFPCQESPWKLVALVGGPAVSLYVLLFAKDVRARGVGFLVITVSRSVCLAKRLAAPSAAVDGSLLYLAAETMTVVGGVLNVSRWPERWCPGRCDTWINSHQLMHVLTGIAVIVVVFAVEADCRWLDTHPMQRACLVEDLNTWATYLPVISFAGTSANASGGL